MISRYTLLSLGTILVAAIYPLSAATPRADVNYDEAKVPQYTLPDPLIFNDGTRVTDARAWRDKRRAEVVQLFETHVFGRSPGRPDNLLFVTNSMDAKALSGKATRKEITIYLAGTKDGPSMNLLLYLPNQKSKPAPVFLGLNFSGNQCVTDEPGIKISQRWMRPSKDSGVVNNRATEATRGSSTNAWCVATLIERGYGTATVYYGDLEPDHAEGWKDGIRGYYLKQQGQTDFASDAWGAIGAWAWGLSRAMDYLETDQGVDAKRVAVHGHSRLGKTALWAGAQDERFAIVISNDSGEGGAAISRRHFGENIAHLNKSFPHWFNSNYKKYSDHESDLPLDHHMLVALSAPRPIYVASAEDDQWADPKGEFLACKYAEPVYLRLGAAGLGTGEWPPVNQPVGKTIGYHMRTGKHAITPYDWQQYLDFADRHYGRK